MFINIGSVIGKQIGNLQSNKREQSGQSIAKTSNQIKRVDEQSYRVKSQSSNTEYDVIPTELGWNCSCPDHKFRGVRQTYLRS
jgi:putative transposase